MGVGAMEPQEPGDPQEREEPQEPVDNQTRAAIINGATHVLVAAIYAIVALAKFGLIHF